MLRALTSLTRGLRLQQHGRAALCSSAKTSVDPSEVAKFTKQASKWWDPDGYAAPLHRMNPARIAFIRSAIEQYAAAGRGHPDDGVQRPDNLASPPLAGVSVIDVGCGGGLVSEPIARLGADVLGIDMSEEGISVAQTHANHDPRLRDAGNLSYRLAAVEDIAASGASFDTVLALEIVEHVSEPSAFVANCARLVRPGGVLVMSTLNRTLLSYALGIVAAERVLKWLPSGTHEWSRFVRPEEMAECIERDSQMSVVEVAGIGYNPISNSFFMTSDTSVNYILAATRKQNL